MRVRFALPICALVLVLTHSAAAEPHEARYRASFSAQQSPVPGPPRAPQPSTPPRQPQGPPAPVSAPPPPPNAPPPQLPQPPGQAINVRVDVTITEQYPGAANAKKSVSVIVADGQTGRVRSQSDVFGLSNPGMEAGVPLNVDASPMLLPNGKIRLRLNFQYILARVQGDVSQTPVRGTVTKTDLSENLSLVLEDGKPLTAAQSADPVGDRQVTVEVKATVLR